jgi:hypothetical protein
VDGRDSSERRTAFLKSLHVLGDLKRLSPQAEQYHSILSSFYLAIKAYKEQLHCEKRLSRVNLVDRVYLPNLAASLDEPEIITTQLPSPEINGLNSSIAEWPSDLSLWTLDDTLPIDSALIGENDVIMRMLWESDRSATDYPECLLPDVELNSNPTV